MSKLPVEYLHHVLDEIAFLAREVASHGEDRFMHDEVLQRAASRSLEIIGEAVKQVPEDIRAKYPRVEWKAFAGLRDRLIHHYFGVDYVIVWDIIVHELPQLSKELSEILQKESSH